MLSGGRFAAADGHLTVSIDIANWLRSLGLEQYAQAFHDNAIDAEVLRELTADDLKDIGVSLVGHRRRLLAAIAAMTPERPGSDELIAPTEPVRSEPHPEIGTGDAERRQLTVMFCDLVGSTPMATRLDPEDMREVIGAYQRRVADTVALYDGFIAKYMGDGVLIYFGYPQAHEDDAERAVRTGLALVDAIGRIESAEPLRARIGVATGLVVVGDLIGAGEAQERGVVGETPNLAARLQTLAGPNAVVISNSTRRLVGRMFEYHDLGEVALAGFANPVPAWRVLGTGSAENRFEAQHETGLVPLVGREEELTLLLGRWRQILDGEGRVVLLTGEAGIGKSHLVRALLERLTGEPHLRLRFFCSEHHRHSALHPVKDHLARAADFARADEAAERLDKLAALLAPADPEPRAIGLLAELLSLPVEGQYALPQLTPQQRKEGIFEALLSQLVGLVGQQPVLMLFEDVHWIDPSSLELLSMIIERVQRLPVLVLISARPEFVPPWPAHAHVTTLSLTRLSRREALTLVDRITGGKSLPGEVLGRMLDRADGVPLFIEELTKAVVESGMLVDAGDRYVVTGPLSPLTIPETLHDSLTARLDHLAPVKEVAQIAASIGREFDYDLLATVSHLSENSLRSALDQLQRAELVIATGLRRGQGYRFKHALVRDAAYAGLLRSRRAQLHHAIANALEEVFPDVVESQPEIVAHHLSEAELSDRAVRYWLEAGRRAAGRSANIEAIAHFRSGIAALASRPGGPARDRDELEFQFALGPCLIATQGIVSSDAVETFSRARELCDRLGNAPEHRQVMFLLASVRAVRGELPEALEALETLRALAKTHQDRPALVNAARGSGLALLLMGRLEEAVERTEEAITAFEASNEADRLATRAAGQDAGVACLSTFSWALWTRGFADAAAERMEAALQRADTIAHAPSEAYARYYASILHALRGEPVIAQRHAERCLAVAEEHGLHWRSLAHIVLGILARLIDPSSGPLDEALAELDQYVGRGFLFGITALYLLLCEALLRQANPDTAMLLLAKGLEMMGRNEERMFEAELYRLKARATLARGRPETHREAQSLWEEAIAIARRQGARSFELRACSDLARSWREEGRSREARDLLGPICAGLTESFNTSDLQKAKALLDELN
jgi:class 3 adenylate cyclase/tetratricopeptide (TPR) repeat protein